jgi:hypothetical protein
MTTTPLRSLTIALAVLAVSCGGIPPNPTSPIVSTPATSTPRLINIITDPGTLPVGGGTALIRVEVIGMNGSGVQNVTLALSVTGGTLAADRAVTDGTGHAKVEWSGTQTETITAALGELVAVTSIPVEVPPVALPPSTPPSAPPAPAPPPPSTPLPPTPGPDVLTVFLGASPDQAIEGATVTFTATPRGLSNENVSSYEWDFDGDGTNDATSAANTQATTYTTHGVKSAKVTIRTTQDARRRGHAQ